MREITGILTPKGLKIRLDKDFCEQLRLNKDKTTNDILLETEIFACLSKWIIFVAGIIAFYIRLPDYTLFILALSITIIMSISYWIHPLFSFFRVTLFYTEPKVFVTITGWFIDKIVLIAVGILTVGWKGLLFYVVGYIAGTLFGFVLNVFFAKSKYSQFGVALQSDENAFIYLSLRYMDKASYMGWMKLYYNHLNLEE